MNNKLFAIRSYITYWLDQVDRHSLHSPFFYDFYTKVVKGKNPAHVKSDVIESLRKKLLHTNQFIDVHDLGAGSGILKTQQRNVKDIARTSLSPAKYAQLYARIIAHFNCKTIVELGTSLGINALYLASLPGANVTTFEGSQTIADIAESTFQSVGNPGIRLIRGDISKTLPQFISQSGKIDLAFIDANHRYEATIQYFRLLLPRMHEKSVLLLDDIHYTREMETAWDELRLHPLVYGSADLYRVGILLFDPSLNKQHVVLQF